MLYKQVNCNKHKKVGRVYSDYYLYVLFAYNNRKYGK